MSVLLLSLILFILSLCAYLNRPTPLPFYGNLELTETVQVIVHGAIEKPGHYSLPRKTSIKEVFDKVILKESADYSKFNLNKKIIKDITLVVPLKKMITIEVLFESTIQKVELPKGSYLFEIIEKINLPCDADWQSLNSNKKLNKSKKIKIRRKVTLA
jgi:hypothetical protein